MAMERRGSASRLKHEKPTTEDKSDGDDDKKHGLLSKLGVTRGKRLSGSPARTEKGAHVPETTSGEFHYKGHRPTQEEMFAHLDAFQRSRTPTEPISSSDPSPKFVSFSDFYLLSVPIMIYGY